MSVIVENAQNPLENEEHKKFTGGGKFARGTLALTANAQIKADKEKVQHGEEETEIMKKRRLNHLANTIKKSINYDKETQKKVINGRNLSNLNKKEDMMGDDIHTDSSPYYVDSTPTPNNESAKPRTKKNLAEFLRCLTTKSKQTQKKLVQLLRGRFIFEDGKLIPLDKNNKEHTKRLEEEYEMKIKPNGTVVAKNRSAVSTKTAKQKNNNIFNFQKKIISLLTESNLDTILLILIVL
jgi:hypothetical protein